MASWHLVLTWANGERKIYYDLASQVEPIKPNQKNFYTILRVKDYHVREHKKLKEQTLMNPSSQYIDQKSIELQEFHILGWMVEWPQDLLHIVLNGK